jgi:hypothetical protein
MESIDVGTLRPGMVVHAVDGDDLGKIVEVHPDHIVVEQGRLFPSDHVIPTTAIASVDDDGLLYLNVDRDTAVNEGWRRSTTIVEGTSPGSGDESYDPTYDRQGRLTAAGRGAVDEATGADEPERGPSDQPAPETRRT